MRASTNTVFCKTLQRIASSNVKIDILRDSTSWGRLHGMRLNYVDFFEKLKTANLILRTEALSAGYKLQDETICLCVYCSKFKIDLYLLQNRWVSQTFRPAFKARINQLNILSNNVHILNIYFLTDVISCMGVLVPQRSWQVIQDFI